MTRSKILGGVFAALLITGLVGCGSTESDVNVKEPKKVVSGSKGDAPMGIVAGELTPNLQKQTQEGKLVYIFSFKNDKETEEVLQYSSTQQYEYQIKDSKGTVVYTYSMDKMFLQTVSEQTVKQGETVEFEIDLSEDLKKLSPGTYKFVVWSVAKDRTDVKAEAEFNWGGEGEGLEEDASKLAAAVVTYVGLMDQNSIEVINENGEHDHYRLSESVKPEFATLEANTKITIHYGMTSDGQKIVEEVIVE